MKPRVKWSTFSGRWFPVAYDRQLWVDFAMLRKLRPHVDKFNVLNGFSM